MTTRCAVIGPAEVSSRTPRQGRARARSRRTRHGREAGGVALEVGDHLVACHVPVDVRPVLAPMTATPNRSVTSAKSRAQRYYVQGPSVIVC